MGKRGPKPRPAALLKRIGSTWAGARAAQEVHFGGDPVPPAWLDGEALSLWNRVVPQLQQVGVTADVDAEALTALCISWSEIVTASQAIKQHGLFVKGTRGAPIASPAVKLRANAIERLTRLCGMFGFTPSDRSRIGAGNGETGTPEGEEDKGPDFRDFVTFPSTKPIKGEG